MNDIDGFFSLVSNRVGYGHMGATIADTVLQAGLNYRTVVAPRVRRLLSRWPSAYTSSRFWRGIRRYRLGSVLSWGHPEKLRRIEELTLFLCDSRLETEDDLRCWLQDPCSRQIVMSLRGFGPKTADYLKMLVGLPAVAVDRHVRLFVASAGCRCADYDEIQEVVSSAAARVGVPPSQLDHAIWAYMSMRVGAR